MPHVHMPHVHMPHIPRHTKGRDAGHTDEEDPHHDHSRHHGSHHFHMPHVHMPHMHMPRKCGGRSHHAAEADDNDAADTADTAVAPPAAPAAAPSKPPGASPYLVMLRLCQGRLSPLDGVGLANCPKPLLRLATQCCALGPAGRPPLTSLVADLQGPILHLLDPDVLEARRPAPRLRGWRTAVQAVKPDLVGEADRPPEDASCASSCRTNDDASEGSLRSLRVGGDVGDGASRALDAALAAARGASPEGRQPSRASLRRSAAEMEDFDAHTSADREGPGRRHEARGRAVAAPKAKTKPPLWAKTRGTLAVGAKTKSQLCSRGVSSTGSTRVPDHEMFHC